jgi:ABC-2 type transport system permease protein
MLFGATAALVRKDLRIFFSDARTVLLTLAVPIVIASFFGFVFSGASSGAAPAKIRIAVVDGDGSAISKAIVERTAADPALDVTRPALDEARAAVRGGRLALAVVIPAGFGTAAGAAFLTQADRPQLELLTDPSKSAEVSMVRGLLTGYVMEAVSQEVFTGAQGRQLVDDALTFARLERHAGGPARHAPPIAGVGAGLVSTQAGAGGTGPRRGLAIPFAGSRGSGGRQSAAGLRRLRARLCRDERAVRALCRHRARGRHPARTPARLWKRLRSAPLSRSTLLVAKAISGTILTLMTLLTSFLFARVVFDVRIASLPASSRWRWRARSWRRHSAC